MALPTNPTTYNTYCKNLPALLVSIIPDWLYLDLETYTNKYAWTKIVCLDYKYMILILLVRPA